MNFDTIFLTKAEYRRLKELDKNPKGLSSVPADGTLVNLRLASHQHYRNEDGSSRGFHSWITDEGRTYLAWRRHTSREKRQGRAHDWLIALFSVIAGALLSRPIWESIDYLIHLFS